MIFLLLCFFTMAASGQVRLQQSVYAGLNIGALAPVNLPNTIRRVEGYWPMFCPSLGYEAVYAVNKNWGVGASLRVDWKGMGVRDSVLYFHTIVTVNDGSQKGSFEGDFSGKNRTTANNLYLQLPVYAVFQPGAHWRYKLGLYFAYLLHARFDGAVSDGYIRNGSPTGEKVLISSASFDFADEERTFDWGIHAGAERSLGSKWAVGADLQWGLRPVFPADFHGVGFNMYNIFATLGVHYKL